MNRSVATGGAGAGGGSGVDRAHGVAGRLLDLLLARPWIALAAALVVHAALWLAVQRDIHTADPLYYATNAHNRAFHPADLLATRDQFVFVMRLGLTAPIALAYRLFGVSTLATNLPCLLAGLAILAIAYAAATTGRGATASARKLTVSGPTSDLGFRGCQRYAVQVMRTSCVHDRRTRRRLRVPLPQHDLARRATTQRHRIHAGTAGAVHPRSGGLFRPPELLQIVERLRVAHPSLASLARRISAGPATGRDDIYVRPTGELDNIEPELLRPAIRGRDISPFSIEDAGLRILLPYTFVDDKPRLISLSRFPRTRRHLERHRESLAQRHCVRVWEKAWFDLHDLPATDITAATKIVGPPRRAGRGGCRDTHAA